MAEVQIQILGRDYTIKAKNDDEAKVRNLATKLNKQMSDLQEKIPNTSDINLFVIQALINLDAQNKQPQPTQESINNIDESTIEKLDDVANKLESLANKVKSI